MGDIVECSGDALRLCYPVSASALTFMVQAQRLKADIKLLTKAEMNAPACEILLTNSGNSKISIGGRMCKETATPVLLSAEEWREFWVTWHGGRVRVGRAGESAPFLCTELPNKPVYTFVMPGDRAHWKLELGPVRPRRSRPPAAGPPPVWVTAQDGVPPLGAIIGGYEEEPLTVIRAAHLGSVTPGKFVPSQGAFIGRDWHMHPKEEFEALVGHTAEWVAAAGGALPAGALPGGHSENASRETLFVARAPHAGHLALGKVHPSHGCAYVTHRGKEVRKGNYEVLVWRPRGEVRGVRVDGRRSRLMANYHEPEAESEPEDGSEPENASEPEDESEHEDGSEEYNQELGI